MPLRTSVTDNPPRSDRRAQASRTNGAKSRGPRSPDGKVKSAKNSRKHGLTGKLDPSEEEEGEIEALIARLGARYQVKAPQQAALIDRAITATLRLNRARALITETLEDIADPENPRRSQEKSLNNLIIMAIRNNMQKLYGGNPPSLTLAKAIAKETGYISHMSSSSRTALNRLVRYAQRFRGERDRSLANLELLRKKTSSEKI